MWADMADRNKTYVCFPHGFNESRQTAGRMAWRLGYRSQRVAHRDRPFEKLFRLQRKLGSSEGWEAAIFRPKGMWHQTFGQHWERYLELDEQ